VAAKPGGTWPSSRIGGWRMQPTGRNAPCPCGSGRKYKHCCLQRQTSTVDIVLRHPAPAIGSGGFEDAVGLYGRGQVLEAEAACKFVLRVSPAHVGALRLAAKIAAERGRLTEAVHLLTTATAAAPHDGGLHRELGELQIKLGRPHDALAILHRA